MAKRVKGTVRWFSPAKGYGIITQDNGPDVYVHRETWQKLGIERLYRGQAVRFTFSQVGEKYQAREVSFAHQNADWQKRTESLSGERNVAIGNLDGDVTVPPKKRRG